MPRPRQYDPDAVLDAAQRAFQARGYEATSVQDLVEATGLSRSSLYHAFGDKHALFLAVLDRYAAAGDEAAEAACCGASPLAAIEAVLTQSAASDRCLMVNAAAERGGRDPETAARADAARQALDRRFELLVRQAQADGDVAPERPTGALAALLTSVVFGLRALRTAGADEATRRSVVEETVRGLRAQE